MGRFYFLFMWERGSRLICTDPPSHTMPDLHRLGCGPHAAVWDAVPQVIILGTFTWKSMVQTHSCLPGSEFGWARKGFKEKSQLPNINYSWCFLLLLLLILFSLVFLDKEVRERWKVVLGETNLRSLKMSEYFDQITLCLQLLSCRTGHSFKGKLHRD